MILIKTFIKNLFIFLTIIFIFNSPLKAELSESGFKKWLQEYKLNAVKKGISKETVETTFQNAKFLHKVIKYDRKQPEFFEDTLTYVSKRATKSRAKKARELLKNNEKLFLKVEKKFNVEKEILLALWGIETNFGKHVGKMDIISSLATLSYDQRRSTYFSSQLFTLLQLIDNKKINPTTLYGSWAGAYGNFQFMPSTISNYAIDFDNNNKIELKSSLPDALASAANYINKIGWKKGEPCFSKVKLTKNITKKYINLSARKIKNKLSIAKWKKKGLVNLDNLSLSENYKAGLIQPDGKPNTPTFLVYDNYEKILKWNRSLRFGISICTLAEMI